MTPEECYAELRPVLQSVTDAIRRAPLSFEGRAALALLVAADAFGVAGGALEMATDGRTAGPNSETARRVADLILAAIEQGEVRRRVN